MNYDIAIIGSGVAGMTAAIYAARASKKVIVLELLLEGGQIVNSTHVDNWPGDLGISGVDLSRKIKAHCEQLGVEFCYARVQQITPKDGGWCITIEDSEPLMARSIILAVGTKPREMSPAQSASAGNRPISYCATCDGALYKGKPVVVVGSGNTAKHEAAYLENIASRVYHIHHDDPIPEDAAAVFVAIGRVPNTALAQGLVDLDDQGYVIAGEDCQASTPGIFVAGDCRTKPLRQLVTAAADGAVAAVAAVQYNQKSA